MSTNFRNKQWFKKMSQEHKNELCEKFDIDEATLKKAGRETENGEIVINLLKIDKLNHKPSLWNNCYKAIKNVKLNHCEGTIEEQVEQLKYIYCLFNNEKFNKYKNSIHNNLLVEQSVKYINKWIDKFYSHEYNNPTFCAYQIYIHVKCLLESDLKLIKR